MAKWLLVILTLFFAQVAYPQTSWKEAKKTKKATIKVYHVNAKPFIYQEKGTTKGLEADIMQEFAKFLEKEYKIEVKLSFHYLQDFGELYQLVKGGYSGTFAVSSFSITEERKKEIQFSPAYMPDIEVLVSSKNLPIIKDTAELATKFKGITAVRMPRTTFATNLAQLERLIPYLKYEDVEQYSAIAPKVATNNNQIAYMQLATYFLSIKQNLTIKRQNLFKKEKPGRAIVFPKESDWTEPVNAFFRSGTFKPWVNEEIKKYFGNDVNDLIWQVANTNNQNNKDVLLPTKEKELKELEITRKELEVSRQRMIRNIFIGVVGLGMKQK